MFVKDAWKIIARMYCHRKDRNCRACPDKIKCVGKAKSTSLHLQKTFSFIPKDEETIQHIYKKEVIDDAKILDETTGPEQSGDETRQRPHRNRHSGQ